jgi:hypothetical protein
MRFQSSLSSREYLTAMKGNMSGHLEFGAERFTGFFVGKFFYVTYHSGYEWNRRYTNQKNAAMGYIKQTECGCEVRFLRFRGVMCPLVFLQLLVMILIPFLLLSFTYSIEITKELLMRIAGTLVLILILLPISTFIEACTERSQDGLKTLLSMLLDPTDPLANYNKI